MKTLQNFNAKGGKESMRNTKLWKRGLALSLGLALLFSTESAAALIPSYGQYIPKPDATAAYIHCLGYKQNAADAKEAYAHLTDSYQSENKGVSKYAGDGYDNMFFMGFDNLTVGNYYYFSVREIDNKDPDNEAADTGDLMFSLLPNELGDVNGEKVESGRTASANEIKTGTLSNIDQWIYKANINKSVTIPLDTSKLESGKNYTVYYTMEDAAENLSEAKSVELEANATTENTFSAGQFTYTNTTVSNLTYNDGKTVTFTEDGLISSSLSGISSIGLKYARIKDSNNADIEDPTLVDASDIKATGMYQIYVVSASATGYRSINALTTTMPETALSSGAVTETSWTFSVGKKDVAISDITLAAGSTVTKETDGNFTTIYDGTTKSVIATAPENGETTTVYKKRRFGKDTYGCRNI